MMADTRLTKSNEPLPAGKMMLDENGNVFGIAMEDSTPNADGTHSVRVMVRGITTYPGDLSEISPVYMSTPKPRPWYARLWKWMRGKG
jgi:hypothetical protein